MSGQPEHQCQKNKEFVEIAFSAGEIAEATKTIKKDMDTLFEELRNVHISLDSIRHDMSENFTENKIAITKMKMIFTGLGFIGGGLFNICLFLIKNLMNK